MRYTAQQCADFLVAAGMDPQAAAIGGAIAIAESGGNPTNVGDRGLCSDPQGCSYGLWQIYMPAHPDVSKACAFDPACAAAAVMQISSSGTDWTPWTTYKTGVYRQYLPVVVAQPPTTAPSDSGVDPGPYQDPNAPPVVLTAYNPGFSASSFSVFDQVPSWAWLLVALLGAKLIRG